MKREDLSLVAFTFLVQLALGAIALAAMLPLRLAAGLGDSGPQVGRLLILAAPVVLLALGISTFHLGVPLGALRSLFNLKQSWLSREILLTGLFTGLVLGTALLELLNRPNPNLLWLTNLTGLAVIFTMARLYQDTFRPAWVTFFTPVSFFATVMVLGAATGGPLIMQALQSGALSPAAADLLMRDIVLTGATALAAILLSWPLYLAALSRSNPAGQASLRLLAGRLAPALALRLAAAVGGLVLLTYGWQTLSLAAVWAGALTAALAELLGRALFFASAEGEAVGQL